MEKFDNLLIVDDEAPFLALVEAFLEDVFDKIVKCQNLTDAKAALDETKFSAIILDINLGKENGGELIAHLKDSPNPNIETPILVSSGLITKEFKERVSQKIDMIEKPFTRNDLIDKLTIIISKNE